MIGRHLGPYLLEAVLGTGGMGTVYRASADGTTVAVKVVLPHLLTDPAAIARFRREAAIGASVRHPNVVATLGAGEERIDGVSVHYLAMEYVEGRTLRALLAEMRRVPEGLCRRIGRDIAGALAAIHAAGVVHRDVKPENVLVTRDDRVKLMDLGIARGIAGGIGAGDERVTTTGAFVGSVQYAAPEQFADGGGLDGRADLHALGTILHELVSGVNPFEDPDWRVVFRRILRDAPERLGVLAPQVSPFFEEVVATLLRKERAERFPDADLVARVLDEGERSEWWAVRRRELREASRKPLRRVRVARESAFVGRAAETAALREEWARVRDGALRIAVVTGEAGIGKTRLVDEFAARLEAEGEDLAFLHAAYETDESGGGSPLAAALVAHLGADALFPPVAAALAATPALVPSFVAWLRGEAAPRGAPPLKQDAIDRCLAAAFRSVAAERPVLLLAEDLHFAERAALDSLVAVAAGLAGSSVFLVATARVSGEAPWIASLGRVAPVLRADLRPLDLAQVEELLRPAVRSDVLAAHLAPVLTEKSGGNPFFVLEVLRGLRDGRVLERAADGSWTVGSDVRRLVVPSTVEELVLARLAGLDPADRDLVGIAACVGFEFDGALVAAAAGQSPVAVIERLAAVERIHGLVRTAGPRFRFDHHQVRERLLDRMDPAERASRHGAIAAALLARAPRDECGRPVLPGDAAVGIVRHLLHGPTPRDAGPYLAAATTEAYQRGRIADAILLADGAERVADAIPPEDRVQVLRNGAILLRSAGDPRGARRLLESAVAAAEAQGSASAFARAADGLAYDHVQSGRVDDALALLERALARLPEDAPLVERRQILSTLGMAHESSGRLPDAHVAYTRAFDLAREIGAEEEIRRAEIRLCGVLYRLGRHEAVLAILDRWITYLRAQGDLAEEAVALSNIGATLNSLGRREEALRVLEASAAAHRRTGDVRSEARTLSNVATVLHAMARPAAALERIRRAIDMARTQGSDPPPNRLNVLGLCLIAMGDLPGARDAFGRALGESVMHGFADEGAWAVYGLSLVADAGGHDATALRLAQRAVAESEDADPYLGYVAGLHLGSLLLRRGDPSAARSAYRRAVGVSADEMTPGRRVHLLARLAALPEATPGDDWTDDERRVAADPAGVLEDALASDGATAEPDVRMEAHAVLARLRPGEPGAAHARAARDLLEEKLADLDTDTRRRALADVRLHREVVRQAASPSC